MSFQVQPQQQPQQPQQQPVQVYPNTVTTQPPSHHSNGSFGTVFIVLAVIVAISAIACFLGRLCNRRYHKHSPSHGYNHSKKPIKQQKQNRTIHPREADIEFGFDKRIAASKPNGHGGSRGPMPQPPANGGMQSFEVKFGDDGGSRGPKPQQPANGGMKTYEMNFGDDEGGQRSGV